MSPLDRLTDWISVARRDLERAILQFLEFTGLDEPLGRLVNWLARKIG